MLRILNVNKYFLLQRFFGLEKGFHSHQSFGIENDFYYTKNAFAFQLIYLSNDKPCDRST